MKTPARIQLPLQTFDLITGFMVWVILSTLLPFIKQDIVIPPETTAWITALPVILGSVLRIPLGYLTNLCGARIVFVVCFIILLFPVYFLSTATTYQDLIIGGIFLGVGGAVFSVGVTSLPKYYPKEKQGFANGVYGMGNIGTALTTFAAPVFASLIGWQHTIQLYLGLLILAILINLLLGDKNEAKVKTPLVKQLKTAVSSMRMWLFSLFYFVTFGAFVALTVFLPSFLVTSYAIDGISAGVYTGIFIVLAAGTRVLGGWLGDHYDSLLLLAGVFILLLCGAVLLAIVSALPLFLAVIFVIGCACGLGNGLIFKLVPSYFMDQAGPVNGIVSMMGGLGGFFPPLVLQLSLSLTGAYVWGFAGFALFAFASLLLVLWLRKPKEELYAEAN